MLPRRYIIGCGPGTITLDLASRVPQGRVTGVDYAASAIERARANAADKKIGNVSFEVGDIFALPFADDTFDLTHAHQVLQHIVDPVKALREIRRVTKPGGIVALRETDVQTFVFYPETEGLTRWVRQLSGELGRRHGCEPEAGRRLHAWARQAGFDSASMDRSVGSWCFSTAEERHFWGGSIINRLENSSLPATAVEKGLATAEEIKETVQALKDWIADEDG